MNLSPIRNADDHKRALARIREIWAPEPGSPEGDEFEVLGILVEAYERQAFPIDAPTPIEAIEFRMDQSGMTRKDLEEIIGSRARVSEVLTGVRALTLPMIRRLHEKLGIPLESLIGEQPKMRRSPVRGRSTKGGVQRPAAMASSKVRRA